MSYIRRKTLKSGKYRYYPVLKQGGREVYLGGYDRKKDAQARLARAVSESAGGQTITFETWADIWLKHIVKVSPRTKDDYDQIVRLHLKPRLGAVKLGKITPADVDQLVFELEENLSPARVRKILTVLRMIFKQAQARGHIQLNPAAFAKPPRQETPEMRFLSWEQTRRLLSVCDPIVATAVLSGLRQGELLALQVQNVTDRALAVNRTWDRRYGYTLPKNGERRVVRIGSELQKILRIECGRPGPRRADIPRLERGAAGPLQPGQAQVPARARRGRGEASPLPRPETYLRLHADRARGEHEVPPEATGAQVDQNHLRHLWPPVSRGGRGHRGAPG